ncbi:MAG: DNA repair protein RecN [Lachnospiraceae bacterium]|nr:DNA repair protein RecN [Lachnospiraceae bacterium]
MIQTLHIQNVGIIDDLSINLNSGFNVLTGETGAGKTLIIDSLGIIAGGRFSKEIIRKNKDYSFIELSISEAPNMEDTIVSREISLSGKNLCKINGRMVTVNELKDFMSNIIDIHGQHDNGRILDSATHVQYLDSFAGINLKNIKAEYKELYSNYLSLKEEISKNYGDEKEKQRKLDLLKYQLNEITEAKLKPNEDIELEETRKIILNSEKISEALNITDLELSEKAIDSISVAIRNLEKISSLNEQYSNSLNSLKSMYYDIQELSSDISSYKKDIYFDEDTRNSVEERLFTIQSLKRKYGNDIAEIIKYKDSIEKEIYEIENSEEYIKKLRENLAKLEGRMLEIAQNMHVIRTNSAVTLAKNINKELEDLEMKNAKIKVNIVYNEKGEFESNGLDKIEFLIVTNVGEDYKPLTKIASGGEMSRIMLAIKTVLADVDKIPVLVFDEIDTGISGKAAKSVAEKMRIISQKHQVLCITHLASIAAKGDNNYYITKEILNQKTETNVKLLNKQEKVEEIARMASGDITEISMKHAKELIGA